MDIKFQVLTILKDKGQCRVSILCRECIFDWDCQGTKSNADDPSIVSLRYQLAKEKVQKNPHVFKEEDLFNILL